MGFLKTLCKSWDRLRMDREAYLKKYEPRVYELLKESEEEQPETAASEPDQAERSESNGA